MGWGGMGEWGLVCKHSCADMQATDACPRRGKHTGGSQPGLLRPYFTPFVALKSPSLTNRTKTF